MTNAQPSIFTDHHDESDRELWLHRAVANFWRERINGMTLLDGTQVVLPERIHISVGFSYGSKQESAQTRGVCWRREVSEDGINHIFISPAVKDPAQVLLTLGHELIHAALNNSGGHRGRFAEIATRLGFVGAKTSSKASEVLAMELVVLAGELGDYPHGRFQLELLTEKTRTGVTVPVGGRYTSGTVYTGNRQMKLTCPEHRSYIVRASRRTAAHAPFCGLCGDAGVLTRMELSD